MPRRRFGPTFTATEEQGTEFALQKFNSGSWELRYLPAPKAIELAQRWNDQFVAPQGTILLVEGDATKGTITTYPLNTNAASASFLLPKYDQLLAIRFVGFQPSEQQFSFNNDYLGDDDFDGDDSDDVDLDDVDLDDVDLGDADLDDVNLVDIELDDVNLGDEDDNHVIEEDNVDEELSGDDEDFSWPRNLEDVKEFFRELPSGFVKDPCFGLGLNYELRFITDTIERIKGVDTLSIFKGIEESPAYAGSTYSISARSLDEVRRAINRTHDAAVRVANSEKTAYANNTLLHPLDGVKYPLTNAMYRKDSIVRALGSAPRNDIQLSAADQKIVVATMKNAAKQLGKSKSREMLELSNEIELVTLQVLVQRLSDMLDKRKDEADWQQFFSDHPFILRLAFGFPVVKMGDQFSVGGRKFDGSGDKVADFAVKAVATGNLGLIEIKTPHTKLLSKGTAYRRDVFAPSWDLSGAVSQVLDQAHHLQRNLAALKENSEEYSVEAFAINAVVIAGRSPTDRAERKSFEFYRNSLRSVVILTFDELLHKLEHLLEVLQPTTATGGVD